MDETTALPAETAAFDIKAFAALIYNDDSVFEALAAEVGALRQLRDEAVAHQFELNQQAEEKRLADAAVRTRRGLLLAMERLETRFVRTSAAIDVAVGVHRETLNLVSQNQSAIKAAVESGELTKAEYTFEVNSDARLEALDCYQDAKADLATANTDLATAKADLAKTKTDLGDATKAHADMVAKWKSLMQAFKEAAPKQAANWLSQHKSQQI